MALFKRKKRGFDPTKQQITEFSFEDHQTEIVKAVNIGSQDIKRVVIDHDGYPTVELLVSSGFIKSVRLAGSENPSVWARLNWMESPLDETDKLTVAEAVKKNPRFAAVKVVRDHVSEEAANVVASAFATHSMSVLADMMNQKPKITGVHIEWDIQDLGGEVASNNAFRVHITEVNAIVNIRNRDMVVATRFLHGDPIGEITLKANGELDYSSAQTDEERYVIAGAAQGDATFQELYENSAGMDWLKVLKTAEKMMADGRIEVGIPSRMAREVSLEMTPEEMAAMLGSDEREEEDALPAEADFTEAGSPEIFLPEIGEEDDKECEEAEVALPVPVKENALSLSDDAELPVVTEVEVAVPVVDEAGEAFTDLRLVLSELPDPGELPALSSYARSLGHSVRRLDARIKEAKRRLGVDIQKVRTTGERGGAWFEVEGLEKDRHLLNTERRAVFIDILKKLEKVEDPKAVAAAAELIYKIESIDSVQDIAYDRPDPSAIEVVKIATDIAHGSDDELAVFNKVNSDTEK